MTLKTFSFELSKIIPFILAFGIILGLLYYKRLKPVYKGIIIYLIAMLATDLLTRFLGNTGNNLIVLIVYSVIELILLALFYFKFLLHKKHTLLLVLTMIAVLYIVGELFYYLCFNTDIKQFQPYAKVADDFVIVLLALAYFLENLSKEKTEWKYFGLNAVILAFFSFNLVFFLPINFLINEQSDLKFYFWTVNVVALVLFYSYLTWLIWKNGRRKIMRQ